MEIRLYTHIVKNRSASELLSIIQGKADTDAIIYSVGFNPLTGWLILGIKSTMG